MFNASTRVLEFRASSARQVDANAAAVTSTAAALCSHSSSFIMRTSVSKFFDTKLCLLRQLFDSDVGINRGGPSRRRRSDNKMATSVSRVCHVYVTCSLDVADLLQQPWQHHHNVRCCCCLLRQHNDNAASKKRR